MKRLLSISLAVFLAVSLGITMVPPQSVEASHEHRKGVTFNIKATGEGSYVAKPPWDGSDQGSGEFSIGFAGAGRFFTPARGIAWGWRSSAGHIKGSFGTHEINVNLHLYPMNDYYFEYNRQNNTLKIYGVSLTGSYDGKKLTGGSLGFDILGPNSASITVHLVILTDAGHSAVDITIGEALADRFKIDIHEVGY